MKYLYLMALVLMLTISVGAQPVSRPVDYRLLGGQVYDTGFGTVIGNYTIQTLESPRGGRSKIMVALVATGWGDLFLFTLTINAPSRDEWTRGPIISIPGSTWAPLGTTCLTRQEDGGFWRVAFRAYLIGETNGNQKETPSQDPSGSNEGDQSKDNEALPPVQEIVSAGSESLVLERRCRRHGLTRADRIQNLRYILQGLRGFGVRGCKLELRD